MKRLVALTVVVFLGLLVFSLAAGAAEQELQEKEKQLEQAKLKLNNLEWKIKLSPIGKTRAKAYEDTLGFIGHKVSSKKLRSEGFSPSNYTLSLKAEEVIVWETMQRSEEAGVAFWHGELEKGVMRGVLSKHPDEKRHIDFSFYSIEKKELAAPVQPEELKKEPVPEPVEAEKEEK